MLLVMTAGFPDGKPLERTLTSIYYNVTSVQFLRTTYKAAPMLALALACLAGAGAGRIAAEVRGRRPLASPTQNAAIVLVPMAVVFVFFVLPVFTGKVIDPRLTYKVPQYWKEAIRAADATTPPDRRVLVAPGQLYASYTWGTTTDAIALGLSKRPYLARSAARYAPPAASQLQARVDETLQQGRLVPGQLTPLLGMMSVGAMLVPADGDRRQSGEAGQPEVGRSLGSAYPPSRAFRAFGPRARFGPEPGRGGGSLTIPAIRLYRVAPTLPGIVRAHPRANATILDGDADGIIQLAAHRALDPTTALFYAGDLDRQAVARQVRDGSQLVFTDTNRRRVLLGTAVNANVGPRGRRRRSLPPELPAYDLFPARGAASQTVATYSGLRHLRAPSGIAFALLPQYRPAALFDGRLDRPWIPGTQVQDQRYVDLALSRPHPVDAIRVYPHVDVLGRTDRLAVSVNGGKERRFTLTRGWNSLPIDARPLRTLRLRIVGVRGRVFVGNGGLDEVQIPGVAVRESLRLPTDLATLARGLDLSRTPVRVLLSRVTADFPGRAGSNGEPAQLQSVLNMVDSERELHRTITLPVARAFGLGGWAHVDPTAPDPALDALAGLAAGVAIRLVRPLRGDPAQPGVLSFRRRPTDRVDRRSRRPPDETLDRMADPEPRERPSPASLRGARAIHAPGARPCTGTGYVTTNGGGGTRRHGPVAPNGASDQGAPDRTAYPQPDTVQRAGQRRRRRRDPRARSGLRGTPPHRGLRNVLRRSVGDDGPGRSRRSGQRFGAGARSRPAASAAVVRSPAVTSAGCWGQLRDHRLTRGDARRARRVVGSGAGASPARSAWDADGGGIGHDRRIRISRFGARALAGTVVAGSRAELLPRMERDLRRARSRRAAAH